MEEYWRQVGSGQREPDEAECKRLAARTSELEQAVVKRTERGQEVEHHLAYQAKIAEAEAQHRIAKARARSYALANREAVEAGLVETALAVHDEVLALVSDVRRAVARHDAAGRAFEDLAHMLNERTASSFMPKGAFAMSESFVKRVPSELEPPIARHALNAEVVEYVTRRQPQIGEQLRRRLADREGRAERLAKRQARNEEREGHEAERDAAVT